MKKFTSRQKMTAIAALCITSIAAAIGMSGAREDASAQDAAASAVAPNSAAAGAVLTVSIITPQQQDWPLTITANGRIAPWQETIIGSELSGIRLAEVAVNVGDTVHKDQVLARLESESIAAEHAQEEAAVEARRAAAAEAQASAERARTLQASKMMSAQQANEYLTAERSANANLNLALAKLHSQRIRLRQTVVRAPDDGVISASDATVGAVMAQGQQLFRLIRQQRLEWRAEVPAYVLPQIKPGQPAKLALPDGTSLKGSVRAKAPTVDPNALTALVYVDLPRSSDVQAGMFTTGLFELGRNPALTVPRGAVVIRDGTAYVYQVGADNKVIQTAVTLGRRIEDRIEILQGVHLDMKLVAQGAGFLADGDVVTVLAASPLQSTGGNRT